LIGRFNFAAETTIQAGNKRLALATITIETNPKTRESRLFKSSWEHVRKSMVAMLNSYTMYKPYTVFLSIGGFFFILGLILSSTISIWCSTVKNPNGAHHLQSLVIGAVLLNASFVSVTLELSPT